MTDLAELGERIERVALGPDEVKAPFARLLKPILARLGVQPKVDVSKTKLLVECVRHTGFDAEKRDEMKAFAAAVDELDTNLSSVERACVVNGRAMVSHGAWLRRLYEVIVLAKKAIEDDAQAKRLVQATEGVRLLPPLAIRTTPHDKDEAMTSDAHTTRLVEMELASVDRLLDAARAERELLGRKRRLLESARQMLLEAQAALPIDDKGASERLTYLAQQISRLDRLEGAGLSPRIALTHQLQQAVARGERERAFAALAAMQGSAGALGDDQLLGLTTRALEELAPEGPLARRASLDQSVKQMFGVDLARITKSAYIDARRRYERDKGEDWESRQRAHTALRYFDDAGSASLTAAAIAVDGCFDLGGAMIPTRVEEIEMVARAVRHPTRDLTLLQATEVQDLSDAVIEDPRLLVLDLAAGRLLARRFVAHEPHPTTKTQLRGEVRAYVLDGSGSMIGPRARMRDAILASELVTMRKRLLEFAKTARIALFYRYFNDKVEPVTRVSQVRDIDNELPVILGTLREGGTDIEAALLSTLKDIAEAKQSDPQLALAQIVLVTDGQADVDEASINTARETLAGMPVGLSVIALGEQNEALRGLVARQRARGERAFYHFIPDDMLGRIAAGELDPGGVVHAPPVAGDSVSLATRVGDLVEEIVALGRTREVEALETLEVNAEAQKEVGLDDAAMNDGERAKVRALYRDRAALERQFDRWFPMPRANGASTALDPDGEAVCVLLATVAETVDVVGGSELGRMADAIDVLLRLLPDARLTPARYIEAVSLGGPQISAALTALRNAAQRSHKSSSP